MTDFGDRVEFGLLVLAGFITGIGTSAYLMITVGSWWFPISAVVAGVVNTVLLILATAYTRRGWRFAPLAAWAIPVLLAMAPLVGPQPLIFDWPVIVLIALGVGMPTVFAARALQPNT